MQRVQLQLDLDVPDKEAALEWVRALAVAMERDPRVIAPVVNSEMAPPLTIKGLTSKRAKASDLIDALHAQGRTEATGQGPWVKVDDYGQEYVEDAETFDYRSHPEGRRAELERRGE